MIADWDNHLDFVSKVAIRNGKLLKGGEPDLFNVSVHIINDWQRGKLPYFVAPPKEADGDDEMLGEADEQPLAISTNENDDDIDNDDNKDDIDGEKEEEVEEDDEDDQEEDEEEDEDVVVKSKSMGRNQKWGDL